MVSDRYIYAGILLFGGLIGGCVIGWTGSWLVVPIVAIVWAVIIIAVSSIADILGG